MLSRRMSALMLVAAAVSACDSAVAPIEPASEQVAVAAGLGGHRFGNEPLTAIGTGRAELPAGFGMLEFSFIARDHWFGPWGAFSQSRTRNGLTSDFKGRVTCLAVDAANNRAWIGGVITANNSTDPAQQTAIHQVGRDIWFRVVDYGFRKSDPDDRTTIFGFTGAGGIATSADYCATKPWTADDVNTFPVVTGGIVVRP